MARKIHFWHGRDKKLEEKIAKFCRLDEFNSGYFWDGSLDDFEHLYGGNFIVMQGIICVTQYNNFGQR